MAATMVDLPALTVTWLDVDSSVRGVGCGTHVELTR